MISQFLLAAALSIMALTASAQTVQTTPNLIQPNHWAGVTYGVHPGDCCTGGPQPLYDTSNNSINFSYGNYNVAQLVALNQALSGTGINVRGFNYSWTITTATQNGVDLLNASVGLYSSSGNYLEGFNYSYNNAVTNQTYSGTENFSQHYPLTSLYGIQLNFQSVDNGFWAGYYGPQVSNISLTANYGVDPCVGNPRYSPSCAGYSNSDMWYTGDLTSVYGTTFAINQALGFGNTGVRVHSVNWGYDYNIGGRWCSGYTFGICNSWHDSYVGGAIAITDINANTILTNSNHTSGENVSGSFRREILLDSTSRDISTLGAASISTYTGGIAAVTPYMGFNFTPDICSTNPLTSSQCPGYQIAYHDQQCSINSLYDPGCPGYQQAYFTQQCSANQLYDVACPGYAQAYYDYQCSADPLYHTGCPGYQQAYFDQQCSADPLYNNQCSGYQQAYFDQQCGLNGLYSVQCPNYADAYYVQQCSISPLYDSGCTGYAEAYFSQQCGLNALYNNQCPGYATAYFNQQCSISALYDSSCPGYQQAYFTQQCSLDGLYDQQCPNYAEAYAKKNILNIGNTTTPVAETQTATVVTTTSESIATPAIVSDPVVNQALTSTATSASPAQAATATVPLVAKTEPAATTTAAANTEQKKEEKKEETKTADAEPSEEKKEETKSADNSSSSTSASSSSDSKDKPKTTRQALAERRLEAARAKAVEDGKQLAGKIGEAASLEAQIQVQAVVVAAMSFVPGFDRYGQVTLPDVVGYKPFEIYRGQRNIDNPASRRFLTGADRTHQEMVDQQYMRNE